MEEMARHGRLGVAAMRAGMDRKTASKYVREGQLPSMLAKERDWRTRPDPFAEDWPGVVEKLGQAPELEAKTLFEDLLSPELEAKTLFEDLLSRQPGRYQPGQLRTLQRRVREWRAQEGPEREVYFAQEHRAGEAMQTDFTWATELGITINGEPFPHMLCHCVLPYSNWEWATTSRSESMAAIKRGVQAALFRLGRVPEWHQTDNSTAATHDPPSGKREFNADYVALVRHLGMKQRTIAIGEKNQNGDVEAVNGTFKRRLEQHLLMRASRDFDSVAAYEAWLAEVLDAVNRTREKRVQEELAAMRPLQVERLPEYHEEEAWVTSWSTIRVAKNTHSVPSRLMGETLRVRLFDDRLEILHGGKHQLTVERLHGRNQHRINYRHVIWSLLRKPGAFAPYRYREDLFPSVTFRKAYDALVAALGARDADIEYLRILHRAASTMECEVERALAGLLAEGVLPTAERVKAAVSPAQPEVPALEPPVVDLHAFDDLLAGAEEVAS
jgi:transposase InsO family protein